MREVKFRARNAEVPCCWVYGYFVVENGCHYIINDDGKFKVGAGTQMEYTGLKDKAKHEICEGDILCMNPVDDEWYDVVVFQNGKFELKSCMNPDGDFHLADWCYDSSNPGLIVGNIYENPELLKENK